MRYDTYRGEVVVISDFFLNAKAAKKAQRSQSKKYSVFSFRFSVNFS
jgi:hypothetical protein